LANARAARAPSVPTASASAYLVRARVSVLGLGGLELVG